MISGGVLCLELGNTKPDNFDEILATLKIIIGTKKHWVISIFDIEDNTFLGDCEVVASTEAGRYSIQNIRINTKYYIKVYSYAFMDNGTYTRTAPTEPFGNVPSRLSSLENKVAELEQKINEITQTE